MANISLKNFILDVFKLINDKQLYVVCYTPVARISLWEVEDVEKFVETTPIDMVYLKSLLTNNEVDVYENQFENYKIKSSESTLYVKVKNKMEVGLMY